MKEISIGILLPSSSIYPIGKQFENGLKSVLTDTEEERVVWVPEFIGQGSVKELEEAIEKLKNYHHVDMIAGWVSNKGLMEVSHKVKGKTPYYINNLGEHAPNPSRIPSNVRLNSLNLWQQLWSLGYWAVNHFGKKGMVVGGLYDMGYSFSMMLDLGMLEASKDSKWSFAVCPMPAQGELSDPEIVLDAVEKDMPDFLFAAFCGEESSKFLNAFIRRGLHTKIPLLGTSYLLEDLNEEVKEPLKVYTTLAASLDLSKNGMEEDWTKPYGAFYQLGREAGLSIKEQLNGDTLAIDKRGPINLDAARAGEGSRVFIIENSCTGKKEEIKRQIIKEEKTINVSNEPLVKSLSLKDSNWLNPYLGI